MSSDFSAFISRDELLGGLPARRASTLLFAIESRTAHLVVRSRQALTHFLNEKAAEARERAFMEAIAQGREPPVRPTIQDLERYAPEWAPLVPLDPGLRASLARLLGQKYVFTARSAPALRRAVGMDDESVRAAFERLHGRPLASVFAPGLPWRERLRWARARAAQRLENASPFWTTFALTLTGMVGTTTLALPIAVAGIGPLAGVVVLLALGLVNLLTLAAMIEAVTRNGKMRYGMGYLGRLVADYLGGAGAAVFTGAALAACAFTLLVRSVGLATTLADGFGLHGAVWAALLFAVNLYFLRRGSFDSTVAMTLVIGVLNVGLIAALTLLALPHVRQANLEHHELPFVGGRPFDGAALGLVFGVTLAVYARHTSVVSSAKLMLRRDPSGRALLWGNVAAMAAAMALFCVWVVAVNGAVRPTDLADASGTALAPLAAEGGPLVHVFGGLFAVLAMGMGSIYMSLTLFHHVHEWFPDGGRSAGPPVALPGSLLARIRTFATSRRGRTGLSSAPVVLVFLLIQWVLLSGEVSFAAPIAFVGAITGPVLSGVFPVLLLVASRRKGEYVPGTVFSLLGHPLVVTALYLLFVGGVFLHGLVLWDEPLPRAVAVAVGLVLVGMNVVFIRRGSYRTHAVVELCGDRRLGGRGRLNVVVNGRTVRADARLRYRDDEQHVMGTTGEVPDFGDLRSVTVHLPPSESRRLKVWAHRLAPEGGSVGLAADLTASIGDGRPKIDRRLVDGQVIVPVTGEALHLEITVSGS